MIKTSQTSTRVIALAVTIVLVTAMVLLLTWSTSTEEGEKRRVEERKREKEPEKKEEPFPPLPHLFIGHITPEETERWLKLLRTGKIVYVESYGAVVSGLADKFRVVFDDGRQALAKFVEPFSLFEPEWPIVSAENDHLNSAVYPRRSGRKLQGWPEVGAGAVARVMGGWFEVSKAPCAIRPVSSSVIYNCEGCDSLEYTVGRMMPEHVVYMGLCGWIEKPTTTPPSTAIQQFLIQPASIPMLGVKSQASTVSDVLVFDYITDNHDRHALHNWISSARGGLLLWDMGLAFNHGPMGRDSCLDLLCGPDTWKDNSKKLYPNSSCKKICKFRNETINILKSMGPDAPPEKRLGYLTKQEIEKEGSPVFEFNIYYSINSRYPKRRYINEDFYKGLDKRVAMFLAHVDDCIKNHGIDNVLPSKF